MLTLAGRLAAVTFVLSLYLVAGQAIWADNDCPDEVADLGSLDATDSMAEDTQVIRAKSPPKLLRQDDSDATPVAAHELIQDDSRPRQGRSHRRRSTEPQTIEKSSRRMHGGLGTLDADAQVATEPGARQEIWVRNRPALSELVQCLAERRESCPFCGQHCVDHDDGTAELAVRHDFNAEDPETLGYVGRSRTTSDETRSKPLRAGEPAQVILDTQRRLGKSVLEGTEFGGSPELLIQWIRALDDENRRQQAILEEVTRDEEDTGSQQEVLSRTSQIESLRNACRQLQEAADTLEEQNLFEEADSIRRVAEGLRRQSRTIVHEVQP